MFWKMITSHWQKNPARSNQLRLVVYVYIYIHTYIPLFTTGWKAPSKRWLVVIAFGFPVAKSTRRNRKIQQNHSPFARLGRHLAALPCHPRLGKILVLGFLSLHIGVRMRWTSLGTWFFSLWKILGTLFTWWYTVDIYIYIVNFQYRSMMIWIHINLIYLCIRVWYRFGIKSSN